MRRNALNEKSKGQQPVSRLCMLAFAGSFSVAQAQIVFEDVTTSAGFPSTGSESWGAAWGDINSDHYPDVYSSNHRTRASLFRNNRDGTFSDASQQIDISRTPGWTGIRSDTDTHGAIWGDVDNDGDDDLYMSISSNSDRLLINTNGVLTDRSAEWEVNLFGHDNARMSLFLDFNGDGLLDMVAASLVDPRAYPHQTDGTFGYSAPFRTELDCNDDASFAHLADIDASSNGLELICAPRNGVYPEDIYNLASLSPGEAQSINSNFPTEGRVNDVIVADFDGDLRPDVFEVLSSSRPSGAIQVGSSKLETQLITARNNVKSTFFTTTGVLTVTADLRAGDPSEGDPDFIDIGAVAYNPASLTFTLDPTLPINHGIQTNSSGLNIGFDTATNTWQIRQAGGEYNYSYLTVESTEPVSNVRLDGKTQADNPSQNKLLMNHPSGWANETVSRGLGGEVLCVTGVAGDFDNDMDQDIYLGCTGGPNNIANIMYENQGDGTFIALPNGAGAAGYVGAAVLQNAGTTESAITADYDIDGFLDIFVTNGNNMRPIELGGPKQLFRNQGNDNNWIEIDLVGVEDNRDGVGATILVTAGGVTQYLEQNGKYHRWSQSHKRMHIGLADNATANVSIQWPNGDTDVHSNVAANKLYSATQNGSLDIVNVIRDSDGDTMDDGWEVRNGTNPLRKDGSKDPDGDLLTNRQEYRYGTDPQLKDTDGDKLRDNVEVRQFFTDPLDRDTDNDGLNDRREVKDLNTDPLKADTDGDTMDDRWEIRNGTNPLLRDGPKDPDGDLLTNRQEYRYGTDPQLKDTDGDKLRDNVEVRKYFTDPLDSDTDNDGLNDRREVKDLNTDPLKADTDGGGVNDGAEITAGTDPLNPNDD